MKKLLSNTSWAILLIGTFTLGLAPFSPEPHLFQKIRWLIEGNSFAPIDVFDIFLHGAFPFLLVLKGIVTLLSKKEKSTSEIGS